MKSIKIGFRLFLTMPILATGILVGCRNADSGSPETTETEQTSHWDEDISLQKIKEVDLLPETDEQASDWPEFLSAKSEIDKIKSTTRQQFLNDNDNLAQAIFSLNDSIPDIFKNKPIQARLKVLSTLAHVSQQNISRSDRSPELINQDARSIFEAFQNLKIQLNEIFVRQVSDIEFDLDREQDSILRARNDS